MNLKCAYIGHYENKIIGRYRSLNMGCTKCIIHLAFVGTVTEVDAQWSCYVTISCDKMIKIILAIRRRRQDTEAGR